MAVGLLGRPETWIGDMAASESTPSDAGLPVEPDSLQILEDSCPTV